MLCDAFTLQLHCFNVEKNLLQWSNQFLEVIMQMVIITISKAVLVND